VTKTCAILSLLSLQTFACYAPQSQEQSWPVTRQQRRLQRLLEPILVEEQGGRKQLEDEENKELEEKLDEFSCGYCFRVINANRQIFICPCNGQHRCCWSCAENWFVHENNNTCTVCRAAIAHETLTGQFAVILRKRAKMAWGIKRSLRAKRKRGEELGDEETEKSWESVRALYNTPPASKRTAMVSFEVSHNQLPAVERCLRHFDVRSDERDDPVTGAFANGYPPAMIPMWAGGPSEDFNSEYDDWL